MVIDMKVDNDIFSMSRANWFLALNKKTNTCGITFSPYEFQKQAGYNFRRSKSVMIATLH